MAIKEQDYNSGLQGDDYPRFSREMMMDELDKQEAGHHRQTVEGLREVIAAQEDLLVAYRIGSQSKADRALTRLKTARTAIAKAETQP